ncbi:MAG: hypothetical protein JW751_31260 [Polyangiaceae bacterium]|nr:hypothetical protein [Polyangiaceae bacterium]
MPSPVSEMLTSAVERHLVPLLEPLGLTPVKYPERLKVGLVARALARRLDERRTFYVTFWCDGGTAEHLTWRADVYDGHIWWDLAFTFPFEQPGFPPPKPRAGSALDLAPFFPARRPDHFNRAIRFLGTLLVTYHEEIAAQVPELRPDIERALQTEGWQAALCEAPELWARRLVQGEVDFTEEPATIVFVGANLVVVSVGTERFTFKFPVEGIARTDPARVSGWWTTPAGTRAATVLRIGSRTWRFDFGGKLVSCEPREEGSSAASGS